MYFRYLKSQYNNCKENSNLLIIAPKIMKFMYNITCNIPISLAFCSTFRTIDRFITNSGNKSSKDLRDKIEFLLQWTVGVPLIQECGHIGTSLDSQ